MSPPDLAWIRSRTQSAIHRQLATITELARYWATEYDWRQCEAKLNALPQFKTEIDGADIHFIHAKSPHADALPLIITHGSPGSIIELLGVVGRSPTRPCTAGAPRTPSALGSGTRGPRRDHHLQDQRQRLPHRAAFWPSQPGPDPRQHHVVLADRHRRLRSPLVMGEHAGRAAGQPRPQVKLPVGFTTFPSRRASSTPAPGTRSASRARRTISPGSARPIPPAASAPSTTSPRPSCSP